MANTNQDVLRLCDSYSNLTSSIREKQLALSTDTGEIRFKAPGGTIYDYAAQGQDTTFDNITLNEKLYMDADLDSYFWDNGLDDNISVFISTNEVAKFTDATFTVKDTIKINNSSDVLKVLIDAGGPSYFLGGDIGIGINPPLVRLHVHKETGAVSQYISTDDTLNSVLVFQTDRDGTPKYGQIGIDHSDSVMRINYGSSFDGTNNGITINASGEVGIGTSSPSTARKFVIDTGTTEFYVDETGSNLIIGANTADDLIIATNATRRIHIEDSSGNVAIGQLATPQNSLHLHENSSGANYLQVTNTGTGATNTDGFILGIDASENAIVLMYENKPMFFYTNNTSRMRIDAAGDINFLYDTHHLGDNVGANFGAGDDYEIVYDGTHAVHKMLAGSGAFHFDMHTSVTQDVRFWLWAGTAKDVYLELLSNNNGTNNDAWRLSNVASDNDFAISHFGTGSWVERFKIDSSGNGYLGTGSNYTKYASDGSLSQTGTARIEWTKITANSVTLSAGTSSEVVADLQTANDGNVYHITEAAATPGQTLIIDFESVTAFNWVNVLAEYEGSATHAIEIEMYNWSTAAWDHFHSIQNGYSNSGSIFGNHDFFVPTDTNYIGTGGDVGNVRVRINHPMAGNASHDTYIDVVALYQ